MLSVESVFLFQMFTKLFSIFAILCSLGLAEDEILVKLSIKTGFDSCFSSSKRHVLISLVKVKIPCSISFQVASLSCLFKGLLWIMTLFGWLLTDGQEHCSTLGPTAMPTPPSVAPTDVARLPHLTTKVTTFWHFSFDQML